MPNIKSAKKRVLQTAKRQQQNQARKSEIKTTIKKVLLALESNDIEKAKQLCVEVESKIAKAKNKGVLHRKTASRKISRLVKKVTSTTQTA